MTRQLFISLLAVIVLAFPFQATAQKALATAKDTQVGAPKVTVMELFSSVACRYCPSAEQNFKALVSGAPEVVPIACYIEVPAVRNDPVGRPVCNQRQDYYAKIVENGRRGTPMFLINGDHMLNNLSTRFAEFVAPDIKQSQTLKINAVAAQSSKSEFRLTLPNLPPSETRNYEVWAAAIRKPVPSLALSADPSAPPKTYDYALDKLIRVDGWNGKSKNMSFRFKPGEDIERIVFLAEDGQKKVVAAGQVIVTD